MAKSLFHSNTLALLLTAATSCNAITREQLPEAGLAKGAAAYDKLTHQEQRRRISDQHQVLTDAARQSSDKMAVLLQNPVIRHAAINRITPDGSILHAAADASELDAGEALLLSPRVTDATINALDKDGITAAQRALRNGNTTLAIKVLRDQRFTGTANRDHQGVTALHDAAKMQDMFALDELLSRLPSNAITTHDNTGKNVLHHLAGSPNAGFGQQFMMASALSNTHVQSITNNVDYDGNTVAHLLAGNGQIDDALATESVEKLTGVVNRDGKPLFNAYNTRNAAGYTPAEVAIQNGKLQMAQALTDAGTQVKQQGTRDSML